MGRHIMGSQIFDYWKDPFGNELEHWTDGDLFTAADPPQKHADAGALLAVQWGSSASHVCRKACHHLPASRLVPLIALTTAASERLFRRQPKG